MDYKTDLQKTVEMMCRMRTFGTIELGSLPRGNVYIFRDGSLKRYVLERYVKGVRKRHGITRNTNLVRKLLRKRYVKTDASVLDADIRIMQDAMKRITGNAPELIISKLPSAFRELPKEAFRRNSGLVPRPVRDGSVEYMQIPRNLSDYIDQAQTGRFGSDGRAASLLLTPDEWAVLPYRENTKYIESKTVAAANGLLARSKSEAGYIEFYESEGILYHYDETFWYLQRTEYDPNGTVRFISPDFVLLRPDGSFLFHEHFGRPDDADYMRSNIEKLLTYIDLGIMPGIDLMITFEMPGGGIDLRQTEIQLNNLYYR